MIEVQYLVENDCIAHREYKDFVRPLVGDFVEIGSPGYGSYRNKLLLVKKVIHSVNYKSHESDGHEDVQKIKIILSPDESE